MKRIIRVVIVSLLITHSAVAQLITSSYIFFNENRTHVNARNWAIRQNSSHEGHLQFGCTDSNTAGVPDFFTTPANAKLTIQRDGNVGIGTIVPAFKLDVNGDFRVKDLRTSHNAYTTFRVQGPDYANGLEIDFFGNNNMTDDVTWSYGGGPGSASIMNVNPKALALGTNNQTHLFISGTGNIGVGTTEPDSKLTVKGTVHTQEVKVDLQGAVAPDYVFKSDYNLPALEDVEDYISRNGHLPEIPSAKLMEKEGINLKEMNLLLLKKVEELTLYMIEQNKMLSDFQKIIEKQNARIVALEKNLKRKS